MKVLWIVNNVLPDLAKEVGLATSASGSWLEDISRKLAESSDVVLAIAAVSGDKFQEIKTDGITWYLLPGNGKTMLFYKKGLMKHWEQVEQSFQPDFVHLHGTEYSHGISYLRRFPNKKVVVSIQGILSRIKDVDLAGISWLTALRYRTLHEWLKFNGMLELHFLHKKNAIHEKEIINRADYANTVNFWDTSVTKGINPKIRCFNIQYNLRNEFYSAPKWSVDTCRKHSIFTNPGGTPLKGLHVLIKAVDVVRHKFPEVIVRVPGMSVDGKNLQVNGGYSKYIDHLLSKYDVRKHFEFLGRLDTEQMMSAMRGSNIAVIPSAIEGTSLILRECMYLGLPSICSFRGGMADYIEDKKSGFLYDFDEYAYLAYRIIQLFEDNALAEVFSKNAIAQAEESHNRDRNLNDYLAMYQEIYLGK